MQKKLNDVCFRVILGGCIVLLSLLSACDGLTEKRVKGDDAVSTLASSAWQRVFGEENLKKLFDSEEVDLGRIKLALTKDGGEEGFFVVEEMDLSAPLKELKDYVYSFADQAPKLEQIVEELKAQEFSEREIELFKPLILGEKLGDEATVYLEQELVLQNYLYALAKENSRRASILGIEDLTIDGQRVQVADYRYQNLEGTEIRQLDAYMKKGERVFLLSAWAAAENFAQNRENYLTLLRSTLVG